MRHVTSPRRQGKTERTRQLAMIHVAKKQLGIADDAYRPLIARLTNGRTESAGEMHDGERQTLLDHFRSLGFAGGVSERPKSAARKRDDRPQANKLRALWLSLWNLGVVQDRGEIALAAFLKRHTGLDAVQWAGIEELDLAIDCLRGWCVRIGYEPKPFKSELRLALNGSYKPGLIRAQWDRLIALGAFEQGVHAKLATWLEHQGFNVASAQFLSNKQADQVIEALGAWLRRMTAAKGESDGG